MLFSFFGIEKVPIAITSFFVFLATHCFCFHLFNVFFFFHYFFSEFQIQTHACIYSMLVFQFHKIASFFCSNFSNNAHRAHHSVSALLNNRKINKISLIKRETLQYHLLICVEYQTDVFISMFVAFHFSFF